MQVALDKSTDLNSTENCSILFLSQVTIDAWSGQGTRSREVAKRILDFVTRRNLALTMSYVPSGLNPADWFSQNLSKSDAI